MSKSQDDEIGDGTTGVVGKLKLRWLDDKLIGSTGRRSLVLRPFSIGPRYPPYPYSRWLREGL